MDIVTPPVAILRDHEELHEQLRRASQERGSIGKAAQAAAELAYPHFAKDASYALAALGLLPLVAKGTVTKDMAEIVWSTDKLKADLDLMFAEHRQIAAALEIVAETAKRERRHEYVDLAEHWAKHAEIEEQVLYLAAIVVGEYVKLRLNGMIDPSAR